MPPRPRPDSVSTEEAVIRVELQLLRVLCQATEPQNAPHELWRRLSVYRFRLPVHQVVFEALRAASRTRPPLRDELLQRLTNSGFPDVDLAPYFEPHSLTADEALRLAARLVGTSAESKSD